jgi:hypothetical protein
LVIAHATSPRTRSTSSTVERAYPPPIGPSRHAAPSSSMTTMSDVTPSSETGAPTAIPLRASHTSMAPSVANPSP